MASAKTFPLVKKKSVNSLINRFMERRLEAEGRPHDPNGILVRQDQDPCGLVLRSIEDR